MRINFTDRTLDAYYRQEVSKKITELIKSKGYENLDFDVNIENEGELIRRFSVSSSDKNLQKKIMDLLLSDERLIP